jgi:hypothetical protein
MTFIIAPWAWECLKAVFFFGVGCAVGTFICALNKETRN